MDLWEEELFLFIYFFAVRGSHVEENEKRGPSRLGSADITCM